MAVFLYFDNSVEIWYDYSEYTNKFDLYVSLNLEI